jgi:hypothetical protein
MSEKEARERAGLHREANRAAATSTSRTPLGAKTQGCLRGILNMQRKASPTTSWEDIKPVIRIPEWTLRAGSGPGSNQGVPGIQAWGI